MKLKFDDLINYFYSQIKPSNLNKIGVEYELFCFDRKRKKRISFFGNPGILEILHLMKELSPGTLVYEGENPIELKAQNFKITLEPGGQIEASFSPCRSVLEFSKIFENYISMLKKIEKKLNVEFVASPVDNKSKIEEVDWVPKRRYEIMRNYLKKRGKLSHYMMKMTASMHVSIDYNSEKDAFEKYNIGLKLAESEYLKYPKESCEKLNRKIIWENTDNDRTGIPLWKGKNLNSFSDYINFAIDVPIMFLYKEDKYIKIDKRFTFRDYMERGFLGHYPDIFDWALQLNTIFTDIRFNGSILELRVFDSAGPEIVIDNVKRVKHLFY